MAVFCRSGKRMGNAAIEMNSLNSGEITGIQGTCSEVKVDNQTLRGIIGINHVWEFR